MSQTKGAEVGYTIENLMSLSKDGMTEADKVIIGILKEKLYGECVSI